jgi:SAM-dependent methyltransferase
VVRLIEWLAHLDLSKRHWHGYIRAMDRYVIRGGREADRLEILARSGASDTSAFWDQVGVTAGFRCLDLGCGPGDLSLALAERVGPTGRVVAVDADAEVISLARERAAAAGLTNIDFIVADVYDVARLGNFDLAYSRLLLQHLSDPGVVLRRMWDMVVPSGVVAIEDADFEGGFCDPSDAGFDFWLQRYPLLLRHAGGDPTCGRKLVRTFIEAGLPAPAIRVTQRVDRDDEAKRLPLLTLEATKTAMIEAGVAVGSEIDAALEALRAFTADPTTVCGGPRHFQAWVAKPA